MTRTLSACSLAVADQILAVLRKADGPLPTGEIEKRAGTGPPAAWGQMTYRMLRWLARDGQVEMLTLPEMKSRYWQLAGGTGFAPPPALAHALRVKPPWRGEVDITLCGYSAAGRRIVSLAAFDEMLNHPTPRPGVCRLCAVSRDVRKGSWTNDPVAVIHDDVHAQPDSGARAALTAELRALASLTAEYPARWRELLEGEHIMQALGGS